MGEEKRSTASAIAEYAPVMISRPGTPKNVHHGCKTWRLVGVAALCSFLHMALWSSDQIFQAGWTLNWIPLSRNGDSHRTFQWSDIEPSQSLEYSSCHEHFLCARLLVPLNWNWTQAEKANGSRVAIAMIKLPAKVSISHPQYGGPVIINPGGPGESGINQVLSHGRDLQTILDSPAAPEAINKNATGKYFDVLSFDPRGVNNTTPELHCFPDVASQASWRLTSPVFGTSWDSEVMIGLEMARATALGASCSRQFEGEGILRYANTAQVVEDMVEIIEKDVQSGLRNSAYLPGHEKLQYWGKSYGTIIGSTFAAMHPDRVGRIVLDGVVDPADHYAGNWLTQLQDSDKIITQFSRRCHQAGPHKCRLYLNTSPEDIEKRFTAILETLKMNPIPVTSTTGGENWAGPQIVTYGDVHLYLLSGMYFPFAMAEQLFDLASESLDFSIMGPQQIRLSRPHIDPGLSS
ncbi:hypothetical protein FKW77_000313 [Venturia effusa]|uniref:AB hydrolase-1 domain-containing protein n=1 Tax=Venturia effusa TaxID=50376 RepID=A0A517LM15_9PEZI|nr:hypothetical protein FKW77_000313 [Venturia effusa]